MVGSALTAVETQFLIALSLPIPFSLLHESHFALLTNQQSAGLGVLQSPSVACLQRPQSCSFASSGMGCLLADSALAASSNSWSSSCSGTSTACSVSSLAAGFSCCFPKSLLNEFLIKFILCNTTMIPHIGNSILQAAADARSAIQERRQYPLVIARNSTKRQELPVQDQAMDVVVAVGIGWQQIGNEHYYSGKSVSVLGLENLEDQFSQLVKGYLVIAVLICDFEEVGHDGLGPEGRFVGVELGEHILDELQDFLRVEEAVAVLVVVAEDGPGSGLSHLALRGFSSFLHQLYGSIIGTQQPLVQLLQVMSKSVRSYGSSSGRAREAQESAQDMKEKIKEILYSIRDERQHIENRLYENDVEINRLRKDYELLRYEHDFEHLNEEEAVLVEELKAGLRENSVNPQAIMGGKAEEQQFSELTKEEVMEVQQLMIAQLNQLLKH